MKRLKSILVLCLMCSFLSSTLGISVYKHYCGDLLEDISVFVKSNPCADESGEDSCSMGKEDSCCEDETEYLQLDVKLVKQSDEQVSLKQFAIRAQLFGIDGFVLNEIRTINKFQTDHPPDVQQELYQKYKSLIFYG